VRTGVGKVRFVALANLIGWRRRALTVRAVLVAGFAAGRFRFGFGRTFAKRRGLTFAGAESRFELPGQFGVLRFECGDAVGEFAAAGTRGFVHAPMLATPMRFSCASLRRCR